MPTAPAQTPVAPPRAAPAAPRVRVPGRVRAWLRPVAGLAILAVLLWRVGTGPFVNGLRLIGGWALLAALVLGALTTVCTAWRWSLVSGGLGVRLPLPAAVVAVYRAVFLNATLPGGVLGDVHRAVRHGREAGDVGRGVRAVVWERTAGQAVQLVLAVAVLLAFPSPVRPYVPAAAVAVLGGVACAVLLSRVLPRRQARGNDEQARDTGGRLSRALTTARSDVRDGLLAGGNWLGVAAASMVAVAGHLTLFLVAAHTAGATASVTRLLPLTTLALLAMAVPANVGGFGPREGVAAWAFGAAGLTAAQGVATAVVYGALVLVSSLPGAVVLLAGRVRGPEGGGVG